MAKELINNIGADRVIKIGYYIPNNNKGFDFFLGWEAHVDVLDNLFLNWMIFG